jgi:hypothetical protein
MKIQAPKDIRIEDFKPEEKVLIEKLSASINTFHNEVYRTLNGRVDFINMNRQIVDNILININASGVLMSPPKINHSLVGKVKGVVVVSARNQTSPTVYPTSAPFVTWGISDNMVTILNITGLQNNSKYSISVELMAD